MEFRNQVVQILLRIELGVELADVLHPVAVVGVAVRCPWSLIVFVDRTNPDTNGELSQRRRLNEWEYVLAVNPIFCM